jgi:hypothetical protein
LFERRLVELPSTVEIEDTLESGRHRLKLGRKRGAILEGQAVTLGHSAAPKATDQIHQTLLAQEFAFQDLDREALDRLPGDIVVGAGRAPSLGTGQAAIEIALIGSRSDVVRFAQSTPEQAG